ncbi:hypothetical protein ACHAQE_010091 [Botrytis cinerea]
MSSGHQIESERIKHARYRTELFRRRRQSIFKLATTITLASGSDTYIVFRRNNNYFTFTGNSSNTGLWPPTFEQIQSKVKESNVKTPKDFEPLVRTKVSKYRNEVQSHISGAPQAQPHSIEDMFPRMLSFSEYVAQQKLSTTTGGVHMEGNLQVE